MTEGRTMYVDRTSDRELFPGKKDGHWGGMLKGGTCRFDAGVGVRAGCTGEFLHRGIGLG